MSTTIHHVDLLADITAYCAARGVSRSGFGQKAVGDPSLINGLENGRELRSRTIRAIRYFMATGQRMTREEADA
jgi:hypothetical protein